jgi:beta-fructofuranosidase
MIAGKFNGGVVLSFLLVLMATVASADNMSPFRDAVALWNMKAADDPAQSDSCLLQEGTVEIGVQLSGAERRASLARGGDGYVGRFRGGYLIARSDPPVQLTGKNASICLRVRDTSGAWASHLLATDRSDDPLADLVFGNGRDLYYRWRTTPPWERVEGIRKPIESDREVAEHGTYGFNGQANDAHDLLEYESRKWTCSVVRLQDDGKVIVADQHHQAEGRIDIECQQVSDAAFFVGSKAGVTEFLNGDIAEILVYNRALADNEVQAIVDGLQSRWDLISKTDVAKFVCPAEGLVLHLDATQVQTDATGWVAVWRDISGNQNHMSQADSACMPRLSSAILAERSVVHFQDGQCLQGSAVLDEGDDSFTIVALWRRDHLNGSEVICEQNSTQMQKGRRAALLAQGSQSSHRSPWMLNENFAAGVLPVSAPVEWFGRDGWHDVIIRFADTVIEFYVDGVLIDEEWPHGSLHEFCGPFLVGAGHSSEGKLLADFTGEIDHIAFWDRALTKDEIVRLSGGREHVARCDRQILGKPQQSIQYWKPRGKAYAGDCMVTCKDGEFHIFYLFDRLHHAAKWGLGAHQYGHFSSKDLRTWVHHPLAVPIDRQWECAMGTGNIIYNEKDEKWYAFYTDCGSRIQFFDKPQRGAWLFRSVSDDGIHFTKDFKPVRPGFDSDIFYVPETGQFHLIAEGGRTHFQSDDLQRWTTVENSQFRKIAERDNLSVICPDTLAWNSWHYFTTGSSRIYKSRDPLGPWEEIPKHIFDGLYYSKMHEFKDGRALAAGWVGFPEWGGNIVVRELVQTPDGELGMKFVPEMIPGSGNALSLPLAKTEGDVSGDLHSLRIRAGNLLSYASIDEVPYDVRIRLVAKPSEGVEVFGLCCRGDGDYESGNELSFRPGTRHVQFAHPHDGGLGDLQPVRLTMHGDMGAMPPVGGLNQPFSIELIAKGRILDVCIDNRRTLVARRDGLGGRRLFFFAEGGEVEFEQIEICPLEDE